MKRKANKCIAVIMAMALTLSLAACGGKESGQDSAVTGQDGAVTEQVERKELSKDDSPLEFIDMSQVKFYEPAGSFAGGDGTEESPYEIATPEQLAWLSWCLSSERSFEEQNEYSWKLGMKKAYYILTADIDLNDVSDYDNWLEKPPAYAWYPIENFEGKFDGQGHAIRGLYSCSTTKRDASLCYYQGLFANAWGDVVIKNIKMEKALFLQGQGRQESDSGFLSVASIIADGDGRLENCSSDARFVLEGRGGASGIGGASYVADCTFTGEIGGTENFYNCVGIGGATCYMENCRNEGTITTKGNAAGISGGLSGGEVLDFEGIKTAKGEHIPREPETVAFLADKPRGIYNCVNTGTITSSGGDYIAAGIAISGYQLMGAYAPIISGCRNEGDIYCASGIAGGICGDISIEGRRNDDGETVGSYTFRDCVNTGKVTALTEPQPEKHILSPATGGMVGFITLKYGGTVAFENCKNTGDVISAEPMVGGFVGSVISISGANISLTDCTNDGYVEGMGEYTAGFLGNYTMGANEKHGVSLTMRNCVNNGDIKTKSVFVGGLCGHLLGSEQYESAIRIEDCANYGDVEVDLGSLRVMGFALGSAAPAADWKFDGFTNNGNCRIDLTEYTADEYGERLENDESYWLLADIVGVVYESTPLENVRQNGQVILHFSDKDVSIPSRQVE